MRHLDLFSGIGGFALAAEEVFGEVEHVFCDNDPFSQRILAKHWPKSLIYGDIRGLTAEEIHRDTTSNKYCLNCSWTRKGDKKTCAKCTRPYPDVKSEQGSRLFEERFRPYASGGFDLLTGGFPCQPFSAAGKRKGTEDDRHLWPEMLRVIRETKPTFVLGENVGGFLTWSGGLVFEQVCTDLEGSGYEVFPVVIPAVSLNAPHRRDRVWIVAHNKGSIVSGDWSKQNREQGRLTNKDWEEEWPTVAASLCRMDDGLPNRMDRTLRLKSLGNAIVPQVAAEIMKAMKLK